METGGNDMMGIVILIVVTLYLYLIMPRVFHRPDCSELKGTNFAHRGIHNNAAKLPENSIKAFRRAVELGYGIELDVQVTKDNQVVVFHDFDLKRMCGVKKKVCELTYEELLQYNLLDSKEKIPLFSEVLKMVNGKVPLLIELKCKNVKDPIAPETDKILSGYQGTFYIQSFHPMPLRWYRCNRPDIIRGQLAECYGMQKEIPITIVYFLQQHLLFNVVCRPDFISYNWKHQKEWSLNICKYLFKSTLAAWTVRSKEQLEKSRRKFDVIIFEDFYM